MRVEFPQSIATRAVAILVSEATGRSVVEFSAERTFPEKASTTM